MERRFRVNSPAVAAELIDGEAVIMNLKTGSYFSARELGGMLWRWIEQGVSDSAMARTIAAAYEIPSDVAQEAVERFLAQLSEHELIRPLPHDPELPVRIPEAPAGGSFTPPVLEVFTDMRDLLVLDPIHDVDEDEGWPRPKPPEEFVA